MKRTPAVQPAIPDTVAPPAEERRATSLWLLRHAEVEARYQGVFGGRIDMDLSPRGHEQAAALARYLHNQRFAALYSSPMRRVQQTLAPLLANGCPQQVILPDLREVDFGDWTGLYWEEVRVKYGVSAFDWLDQLDRDAMPQAECTRVLRARLEPCLQRILRAHPGEQVAVACHGGVIRVLLSILLDLPLPKLAAFDIDYASITQIGVLADKAELRLLNFAPWRL